MLDHGHGFLCHATHMGTMAVAAVFWALSGAAKARSRGGYRCELQAYEDRYRSASLDEARFGKIVLLPLPMRSIAASQIRAMREQGRDVAELVDQRVCSYIKQHGLYLTQEGSFESQ